jgi:hypothetical protein
VRVQESSLHAAGKNLSEGGAYVVTSDDVQVQIHYRENGIERIARGRIVRLEHLVQGTFGIALEFDQGRPFA